MNPATTNTLLHRYDLGTEVLSVTQANRSRHTAWKLTTNRDTYVVKILASKDLDWIAHYEITEGIATRLADLGINAVAALRSADRVVTEIAGSLFAVYPWIEGDIDPPDTHRSVKIARILAAIHNANLADDARPPKYPSNFDLDLLETLSDEDLCTLALETNRPSSDYAPPTNPPS